MILLPYGECALLVEVDSTGERDALQDVLRTTRPTTVSSYLPAHRTVLVRCADAGAVPGVVDWLRGLSLGGGPGRPPTGREVHIVVRYDGPDLADVGRHLGVAPAEVVRRHIGQTWTVDFVGFTPGFGYLSGDQGGLTVPRRDNPRTRIPRGAVALAGEYAGVYPSASPGGWQIIGHTDMVMFDPEGNPPAVLTTGTRVRFVNAADA